MGTKIRFGLVGLGARAYAWLVHTKNNPDIEVVAGADISEAARAKTRETAPHLRRSFPDLSQAGSTSAELQFPF